MAPTQLPAGRAASLWLHSGGLIYHVRALRYRQRLWRPFCTQAARWLDSWHPPAENLLIVGPSAGYTLSGAWLARFQRIDVLEPDPLARWLLGRRFPGLQFHAGTLDCFTAPDGPAQLALAYPDHAILFANVIGQMLGDTLETEWLGALQIALRGRNWATYHDVISTDTPPACTRAVTRAAGAPLEEVMRDFWQVAALSVHDHGTFGVLPGDTGYAVWSITPHQHHLVAWNAYCMMDEWSSAPA